MPTMPITESLTIVQQKLEEVAAAQAALDAAKADLDTAKDVVAQKDAVVATSREASTAKRADAVTALDAVIAQLAALREDLLP